MNKSSASPHASRLPTTPPSAADMTTRRAGLRKTTKSRRASLSMAIGKFERLGCVGQAPTTSPSVRSATSISRASGTLTKTRSPSTWKLSGVCLEPDVADLCSGRRVDYRQRACAITDKHALRPVCWAIPRPASLGEGCDHLGLHHWHCGTGIWPNRDIVAARRHVAGLSLSLPTAPPPMARTPPRKAGASRPQRAISRERRTVRWREMDSNFRFRRERTGFRASVCCLRGIGASERTSRFSPVL